MATTCTIVVTQLTPNAAVSVACAAEPAWGLKVPAGHQQLKTVLAALGSIIANELSMD